MRSTDNIWFSYRIPIGSGRIRQDPVLSDYQIRLSEIVGSDIRQLPIGILSQGIRQLPIGSCRKLSDSCRKLPDCIGFPVGSDGIRQSVCSSWGTLDFDQLTEVENKLRNKHWEIHYYEKSINAYQLVSREHSWLIVLIICMIHSLSEINCSIWNQSFTENSSWFFLLLSF